MKTPEQLLKEKGIEGTIIDIGNFYQVTKEGELLGYIMKENMEWKEKGMWKG